MDQLRPISYSQSTDKRPLLILGAPPRGGNHLLRGLLDHHPQLLLPPDEDYFVRHLSRSSALRWLGCLSSARRAPAFYRRLQKDGHLERINAGHGTEVFGTEDSLDLPAYYDYIRSNHQRGNVDALVRNHVEALARAIGGENTGDRLRVFFCALQPSNRDLTRVSQLLSRSYDVRGVFLIRDPRAHLSSKLVRNPTLNLGRYCKRQNRYWEEIQWFEKTCGPALRLRFEDLVTNTEDAMRRVCELAEIQFLPGVLDFTQGGQPSISNSSFASSSGVDRSALLRYRETLPEATIRYLQEHCVPDLFWDGGDALPTAGAGAPAAASNP
jgi:hypothetical protein